MSKRELASLVGGPTSATKRIRLSVRVESPGEKAIVVPDIAFRFGQEGTVEATREFVYPTAYGSPGVSGTAIDPATPIRFEKVNTGMTMKLIAEPKGQLILIRGKVEVVKFDRFIRMGGELGRPIMDENGKVIADNRIEMPALRTFTTPVYLAVRPDTPTQFEIDYPKKGTRVTITVHAMK